MKKWILNCIPLVLCIAVFMLGMSDRVMKPVDDAVILANRAPVYWEHLAMRLRPQTEETEQVSISPEVLQEMTAEDWRMLQSSLASGISSREKAVVLFPNDRGLIITGNKASFGTMTPEGILSETEKEGSREDVMNYIRDPASPVWNAEEAGQGEEGQNAGE